jgi:hypothetical protein
MCTLEDEILVECAFRGDYLYFSIDMMSIHIRFIYTWL